MSMTQGERNAKMQVMRLLTQQGYRIYAEYLSDFDLNITDDPNAVGYMEPEKGVITLNRQLDLNSVSVVVRHEILHDALQHHMRVVDKVSKEMGYDINSMSSDEREEVLDRIYGSQITLPKADGTGAAQGTATNLAGDYDISNQGYTEADKRLIKKLKIGEREVEGLVTDSDHPEWIDLSYEEMYNKIMEEARKQPLPNKIVIKSQPGSSQQQKKSGNTKYIHGSLKDDSTFLDTDGNPVKV